MRDKETIPSSAAPRPRNAIVDKPKLLKTSVVGSYPVPNWLARFKNEYHRSRLSREGLREIEEVAIRAAVIDQELVGLDIVSDGEYTRDNDIDYLFTAIPAISIRGGKHHHLDYFDATLTEALPDPPEIDLAEILQDFSLVRSLTDKTVKVSLAGPFSLARRIRNEAYPTGKDMIEALARALNIACKVLEAAGATHIQLDEPLLAGYPEQVDDMLSALRTVMVGVGAHVALHICYGNRYARPAWEGHYDFLFPGICEAPIDELVLEFARKGLDDLQLLHRYPTEFEVGVGVVDVKDAGRRAGGGHREASLRSSEDRPRRAACCEPGLWAEASAARCGTTKAAGHDRGSGEGASGRSRRAGRSMTRTGAYRIGGLACGLELPKPNDCLFADHLLPVDGLKREACAGHGQSTVKAIAGCTLVGTCPASGHQ